jgi:hypothetical protein
MLYYWFCLYLYAFSILKIYKAALSSYKPK